MVQPVDVNQLMIEGDGADPFFVRERAAVSSLGQFGQHFDVGITGCRPSVFDSADAGVHDAKVIAHGL